MGLECRFGRELGEENEEEEGGGGGGETEWWWIDVNHMLVCVWS